MKNNTKTPTLQMQILTWEKDSHGLYDYEATRTHKQYFQIQGPCKMFRNWLGSKTVLIPNDKIKRGIIPDQTFSFLSSICLKHIGNIQSFIMTPPERPSQDILKNDGNTQESNILNTNTYLVVRYYKQSNNLYRFPLEQGNIVKLGRVQFRVVQIGGLPKIHRKKQESFLGQYNGTYVVTETTQGACKFCLCQEVTEDNYLISPCKCKGSCEGVHIQCLKTWIDSKIKKQVNGVVLTYNFTKFQCQICKQPFPRIVAKQGHQIQMITIQKPEKPHIILQSLNQRKQTKEQRCLHLICPQQGSSIKMGRGHQCQIRLQDISVSRMHSQIIYDNGQFYISDSNSKFGTLVKLDRQIELNSKIKLQCGRSLIDFNFQQ